MRFRWVIFIILLKRWSLFLGLNCMWKRIFIYRYYNFIFGVGDIFRKKSFLISCENVIIFVYICKLFSDVFDLYVVEVVFKLKCLIEYIVVCNIFIVNKCKIIIFKYNDNRGIL